MEKYFIPTYEQAVEICTANGDLIFYETKINIDGYNVSLFNYRLATYNNFLEPVVGKNYNARELRGLCFVFNTDGTLFNRYLMLNKFWNIDQVEETQYHLLQHKKIKSVYYKEDGSLISFIMLPNGRIIPKTKMGIDNEQILEVNALTSSNPAILKFVSECFDKNYSTMWEYTSFKNRIVLEYSKSDLTLLKIRNNNTGEYIDIEQFRNLGFSVAKTMEISSLENIMSTIKDSIGIEGGVITFDDDDMAKYKCLWYNNLHHLIDNVDREDLIIEMVLNETIDDAIVQLDKNKDLNRIEWIKEIESKIHKYITQKSIEINELVDKYDGDVKKFAYNYIKHENFHVAMIIIRGKCNTFEAVKGLIIKNTSRLGTAREFIRNIK